MDAVVDTLAQSVVDKFATLHDSQRYLVGISGIPGSGKSTLAKHVCDAVNAKLLLRPRDAEQGAAADHGKGAEQAAVIIGMDGWHYPRSALATFPDPQEARDRRGAAFTFDAAAFADFVTRLKGNPTQTVHAPSFDHAKKDPIADDIAVYPSHRIIFVEGLYCNCGQGDWARGAQALDERWVVQIDRNVARERLRVRHVQTGVAQDEKEALWRADNNDLPNGDWLLANTMEPAKRIQSLEEMSWA